LNTIVTETTEQGEVAIDVFQKLAADRVLFITGVLDDDMAADITAMLLVKDSEDTEKKISLFINSPGGDIRNALAICDIIHMLDSPIETVCIGSAMKEAAVILAAGTPGMRLATKNSIICVGQLINDSMQISDLTDADISLKQMTNDNKRMMEIIAKASKKSLEQVMSDFDRRIFMNSKDALSYGLIDKVISLKK
jgi:ATP-dependent Clp protease, protease subunit